MFFCFWFAMIFGLSRRSEVSLQQDFPQLHSV